LYVELMLLLYSLLLLLLTVEEASLLLLLLWLLLVPAEILASIQARPAQPDGRLYKCRKWSVKIVVSIDRESPLGYYL